MTVDNDFRIDAWPSFVLIAPDGKVQDVIGSMYQETEESSLNSAMSTVPSPGPGSSILSASFNMIGQST